MRCGERGCVVDALVDHGGATAAGQLLARLHGPHTGRVTPNAIARSQELTVGAAILTGIKGNHIDALEA